MSFVGQTEKMLHGAINSNKVMNFGLFGQRYRPCLTGETARQRETLTAWGVQRGNWRERDNEIYAGENVSDFRCYGTDSALTVSVAFKVQMLLL